MYDSMMAGLPIVCAFDAPDTLVREFDCGYQCNPQNKSEVKNAIMKIVNMPIEKRLEMGQRVKEAVLSYFTYYKLAKQFEAIMEEKVIE